MAWDQHCVTVLLASPTAVELSMRVGVGGWGKQLNCLYLAQEAID